MASSKVDQLDRQLTDYPKLPNRVMPTKLGNILRRTEDSLVHAGDDVQGFAMRRRSLVPMRVQIQHDQFRDRLDMYCTLVFVTCTISGVSAAVLYSRVRWYQTAAVAAAYFLFALACYGSAVASARGYCVVLKEMDAIPDPEATSASESSAFRASCRQVRARLFSARGK
jgi:hypothetical protein